MSEKTVTITELDGKYLVENYGIPEFAIIGILECILFEMRTARHEKPSVDVDKEELVVEKNEIIHEQKEALQESDKKVPVEANTPNLRTRISSAVKAIKALGGEAEDTNRTQATEEELQTELEELTEQYRQLKNSKKVR